MVKWDAASETVWRGGSEGRRGRGGDGSLQEQQDQVRDTRPLVQTAGGRPKGVQLLRSARVSGCAAHSQVPG